MSENSILSLAIGAVVIDVVFLKLNFNNIIFVSKELTRWYTELGPFAMCMDVIIILLATYFGIKLSGSMSFSLKTLCYVVGVQVVHDVLFYLLFRAASKENYIMCVFKRYADEIGKHAIWSDSLMVIGCLLIAYMVKDCETETKVILLLMAVYWGLFELYSKKPTSITQ